MSWFFLAEVKGTEAEKANGKAASIPAAEESGKKERSVLQAKLTRLAIQIGYAGENFFLTLEEMDIFICSGSFVAACTVLILVIRFCIKTYAIEERPFSLADFQYFINFLIIGVTVS